VVRKNTRPAELAEVKPSNRATKDTSQAKADAAAREAGAKLAEQFAKAKEGLRRGFSQGTAINVWGEGGPAYADYAQTVKSIYDDAWIVLPDISLDAGLAVVKVTIARDGRVVRATIIDRSGQRSLDLSVQQALDRVRSVPPFPPEVKDDQRTFTIEFDLKTKRSAG
jgi:TonB family protein